MAGLLAFAVRHPALAVSLFCRGLRNRKAFVQFLRLPVDLETIRRSPLFDGDWYRSNHPELVHSRMSPELHYLLHDGPDGRHASPRFSGDAYFEQNPELRESGLNPLVHYEQYGRFTGLPISSFDATPPPPCFPPDAAEVDVCGTVRSASHRRTALFAVYAPGGHLPEADYHYLRGLLEVADNVIVAGNGKLPPAEIERLRPLAARILFRRHDGYDFGSYRLALTAAKESGWLSPDRCDELLFANDSCHAPVHPFADMFRSMAARSCDFWGITSNDRLSAGPHLQSYFLVFRKPILASNALDEFFAERPLRVSRRDAILLYETQLTAFLRDRGFVPATFVPRLFLRLHSFNPTTLALTLMRRYRVPLVKAKALRGETREPPAKVLAYIQKANPDLGACLRVSIPPEPRFATAAN